jgi:2-keto-3-deoxy-L-arabinonate dehydratase
MTSWRGVYPILYAFFDSDGALDMAAMRRQIDACIAAKPDGLAVLGIATEVEKLAFAEKEAIVRLAAERIAGRLPLVVTIGAPSAAERARLIAMAADHGASWLILQPPPEIEKTERVLLEAFSDMMATASCNVAIQHAPQYLGVGLTSASFNELRRRHPNFTLLKGEGSALETVELIAETSNALAVFAGRGGLEWPDMIRIGAAGLIPAPEALDLHLAIWRAAERGDMAEADRIYENMLPLVTFLMQSIPVFRCYGRRLLARRLGLGEVHDRQPALAPAAAGMALLSHWSRDLQELTPSP